ncbi:hypothetical protein Acsp03_22600 [Actinomadura sp. NBRC 104412]|uniref:DUF4097 family beta strand repeat-containing protein n=1 Tax=Actinomadura sp. NBRC 104412 TaxID=3032203 RepID=UPI0024A210D1|nr:DUF4097 family beta strand repeat-containing protein [Actinomadura sp. NBRC 104412]GLZ04794.1 hypothetical protein Acsp03_22600 [Actinomadura sp. NBRC 104412]
MKTQRGLAVTAAAVALAATAVAGCSVDFNAGIRHETKSYDIPGSFPTLAIGGDSGRLEVVGTDRSGIRVVERLNWTNKKNKPKTRRTVRNGTLTLDSDCKPGGIGYTACGADFRVEVPRKTAVRLTADSGSVEVSGLTGDSLSLTSDSGSIKAKGIRTKTLTATAESGRIELDGHADTVTLRADSGRIKASGLNAKKVTTRSESGMVSLALTAVPDNVDVQVDSGMVKVVLPQADLGYNIDLTSESGHQSIDSALHRNNRSPHHVKVRTESGMISIDAAGAA